jgi:hypothetical protein
MTVVNKLTNKNQKYVQKAGFIGIIPTIGVFLLKVVMKIVEVIVTIFRIFFFFRIDPNSWGTLFLTLAPGEGLFYKYLLFSMKCGFFLVVFAFGGPLIALIGISFMYKNLFKKMGELKKDEDEKDDKKEESQEPAPE